ncbi:hypothetical protein ACS0TY_012931 [Phlomoides rotata]
MASGDRPPARYVPHPYRRARVSRRTSTSQARWMTILAERETEIKDGAVQTMPSRVTQSTPSSPQIGIVIANRDGDGKPGRNSVLSEYPEAKMASELQVSSLGEAFQELVKRLDDGRREYRKTRSRRVTAAKKSKEKELELSVQNCLEEQFP